MSDLNDFFAKKDRKKKKAAAKNAASAPTTEETKKTKNPENVPSTTQATDGWIEIDDPRGTQVHTGGRTVGEFRRNEDETETGVEGTVNIEKFSGWGANQSEDSGQMGGDGKDPQPAQAPSSSFPSLADAAKVQKVPATYVRPGAGSSQATTPGRPRFINTDKEKLRRKLAEREAAAASKP